MAGRALNQPKIYLGDLARALHGLDHESRQEVAALLGFLLTAGLEAQPRRPTTAEREEHPTTAEREEHPTTAEREEQPPSETAEEQQQEDDPSPETSPVPSPEYPRSSEKAEPAATDETLDVEEFLVDDESSLEPRATASSRLVPADSQAPPMLSLLEPRESRSILAEMVGMERRGPGVNLQLAVRSVARQEPLSRLPLERTRTLVRGCDLLIGLGAGLQFFQADREQLVRDLRGLLPEERLAIWHFWDNPTHGVTRDPAELEVDFPVHPGRPVVVVSDFGASSRFGMSPSLDEDGWLNFAARLRDHDCPLVGLIPLPESRWPQGLASDISFVTWDRSTTCGDVRKARAG